MSVYLGILKEVTIYGFNFIYFQLIDFFPFFICGYFSNLPQATV